MDNNKIYKEPIKFTRTLQILFIIAIGLIVIFWLGDLLGGLPAKVSDRAITEGWAEDANLYKSELIKARFYTLYYAIPAIILLTLTIKSVINENYKLFYWTFLIGLTLFQIIPTLGLFNVTNSDPSFFKPVLAVIFFLFLMGQLFSVFRLYNWRKLKQ